MNIWIINPYGNLPGEGWRDYRSTMLATAFNKRGHKVIWWVSNFEHRSKKYRSESWKDINVNDDYHIMLVPSTPYYSHISMARIRHERNYAKNLIKRIYYENNKPDLIILADPSLFYSEIIIRFIRKEKIPLIVDILDLWPELFHIILPDILEPLGKLIFAPLYWKRSWLLRKADGIIGATADYLEIGESKNKTARTDVAYLGIDLESLKIQNNYQYSNPLLQNIIKGENEIWVIYAGTLGKNYDILAIINCSKRIKELNLPIKIFLAGEGELRKFVEHSTKSLDLNNLIYLGILNTADLNYFYRSCDIALSCYVRKSTVSMPVKAFDYLAAGLPIINSLGHDLGKLIIKYNVGLQYVAEDVESMTNAIQKLSENKDLLNTMKKNALELAESFDCSHQSEKVVAMAERIFLEKGIQKN
jgi:glycosyltransferase involved in cell wall biosynthesis